ncbi:kinase-like protein [Obba rivulosa]|uniref:Kinase-like protein n=1 Tax=Obba rivulosa TaxID=1052685 RepID=A0A8E2AUH7_9APHY|nr:kinase-like protein [Obba rivulosa]
MALVSSAWDLRGRFRARARATVGQFNGVLRPEPDVLDREEPSDNANLGGTWRLAHGNNSLRYRGTLAGDDPQVHISLTAALEQLCANFIQDITGVGWMTSASCATFPSDGDMESWIELLASLVGPHSVDLSTRELILQKWINSSRARERHPLQPFLEGTEPEHMHNITLLCILMLQDLCCSLRVLPSSYILHDHPSNLFDNETWLSALRQMRFVHAFDVEVCGHPAAFEILRSYEDSEHESLKNRCRETIIWTALRHENIVQCYGAFLDKCGPAMTVEWMPNGTVMEYLKDNSSADHLKLIEDIARGLHYLHDIMHIVHGNVQPLNILVNAQHAACLSDFSSARLLLHPMILEEPRQYHITLRYAAPERLLGMQDHTDPGPSRESDIYTFSMSMFEIFSGEPPFSCIWDDMVVPRITAGERPGRPPNVAHTGLSDYAWDLVQRCWQQDAKRRPCITQVQRRIQKAREVAAGVAFLRHLRSSELDHSPNHV